MKRTMKLGQGRTVTFDDKEAKVYESPEEWKAEGERRFGKNIMDWQYKCPMCGHVVTVKEFAELGIKDAGNIAYQECIGRYTGKGSPQKGDSTGCNWTANGLFGIPHGGVYIFTGEDKGAHVFDFAEV